MDPHAPAEHRPEIPKLDLTIALWLLLFVLGGGLLALYYSDIGYFPEFTWQDGLTYMALLSIIGGSLLLAYSLLLFVPGAIWSEVLVFDTELRKGLTMRGRRLEPCVLSIAKRILVPFGAFIVFAHALLYFLEEAGGGGTFVVLGATSSLSAVSWLLAKELLDILDPPEAGPDEDGARDRRTNERDQSMRRRRLMVAALHAPLLLPALLKTICRDVLDSGGYDLRFHLTWFFLYALALLPGMWLLGSSLIRWRKRRAAAARVRRETGADVASEASTSGVDRPARPDCGSIICRAILAFDVTAA